SGRHAVEIVVVDDHSRDDSREIVDRLAGSRPLRIIEGPGRGAAAAINAGILAATHGIICQVDQDVVVGPGWLERLVAALEAPDVAAAQGYYTAASSASCCARAMGLDLDQRYAGVNAACSDHVCTGNTAYRAAALHQVGLFDERLGYGYDNDMSYRLRAAGYRLVLCRDARSVHHWREGLWGYLTQQYGFGYGRMDVVAKHPRRFAGDSVSAAGMMAHPVVMALSLVLLSSAALMAVAGWPWTLMMWSGIALVTGLVIERAVAGIRATVSSGDRAGLLFIPLHLVRDLSWVAAMVIWSVRRACGRRSQPSDSMEPRVPRADVSTTRRGLAGNASTARVLALIPAFNEADNLEAVVSELRDLHPHLDLLVIDDGSTDETPAVLRRL
ncbi:MAG: glycosyltransferase, partial [Gemmatimonadetes bacterium]|nr:glycosyltransferase [Gemmatimonadota bacterium]